MDFKESLWEQRQEDGAGPGVKATDWKLVNWRLLLIGWEEEELD